jgi:hypothetical protein
MHSSSLRLVQRCLYSYSTPQISTSFVGLIVMYTCDLEADGVLLELIWWPDKWMGHMERNPLTIRFWIARRFLSIDPFIFQITKSTRIDYGGRGWTRTVTLPTSCTVITHLRQLHCRHLVSVIWLMFLHISVALTIGVSTLRIKMWLSILEHSVFTSILLRTFRGK